MTPCSTWINVVWLPPKIGSEMPTSNATLDGATWNKPLRSKHKMETFLEGLNIKQTEASLRTPFLGSPIIWCPIIAKLHRWFSVDPDSLVVLCEECSICVSSSHLAFRVNSSSRELWLNGKIENFGDLWEIWPTPPFPKDPEIWTISPHKAKVYLITFLEYLDIQWSLQPCISISGDPYCITIDKHDTIRSPTVRAKYLETKRRLIILILLVLVAILGLCEGWKQ